jgi:hypothetical protein
VLYAERKRLATLAEAEARGESFWTEELTPVVRRKLVHAFSRSMRESHRAGVLEKAARDMYRDATGDISSASLEVALQTFNTDAVLTYVEAISQALRDHEQEDRSLGGWAQYTYFPEYWDSRVEEIFNRHRVAYRFVDGQIVPLSSDELHVEVVEPTLRLLHGRKDFESAHDAYMKALKEITNEDAPDAITDAGTALQETLTALGCQGNQLGDLLRDAKKRGLLGPHDQKLINGIESFGSWASAERSQSGDAHKSSDAVLADAWLMVHVVGALIVRLANPSRRHGQASTSS